MTSEELSRLEELANVSFMNDPRWVEDPDFFLDLPNYDGEFIVAAKPGTVLELIALAKWALQAREALVGINESCKETVNDHHDNCGLCKVWQAPIDALARIPTRRQVMSEKTFTVEAKVEVRIPSRPNWITINGKGVNTADCSIELLEKIGKQWTNTLIQEAEAKRRVGKSK